MDAHTATIWNGKIAIIKINFGGGGQTKGAGRPQENFVIWLEQSFRRFRYSQAQFHSPHKKFSIVNAEEVTHFLLLNL